MARDKNEDSRGQRNIRVNEEQFIRTRDSVMTSLATLSAAVQDLSRAYVEHSNAVLGPASKSSLVSLSLDLINRNQPAHEGEARPNSLEVAKRKRRQRAPKDPNAPKRPLTAYFLFMNSARSEVMEQLHAAAKDGEAISGKAVAAECTRRWHAMSESDRQMWQDYYQKNRRKYMKKAEAYKTGGRASNLSDGDVAAQIAAENEPRTKRSALSSESSPSSPDETPLPQPIILARTTPSHTKASSGRMEAKKKVGERSRRHDSYSPIVQGQRNDEQDSSTSEQEKASLKRRKRKSQGSELEKTRLFQSGKTKFEHRSKRSKVDS